MIPVYSLPTCAMSLVFKNATRESTKFPIRESWCSRSKLTFFSLISVYLIIFMFCWASFVALFAMLEPLLLRSYKWRPSWKVCYFRPFFCCKNNRYEVEFRQAILGLICLCPVIIWVVYRKGQLISKSLFYAIVSTKTPTNFFKIFWPSL